MKKQFTQQAALALFSILLTTVVYAEECRIGRFNCNLRAGVEFSQEKEKFSEANPYVQFVGDTLWGGFNTADTVWNPGNVHTFIDLTLASIPSEQTEQSTDTSTGETTEEDFVASNKSLNGSVGLDWRLIKLPSVEDYTLFVGLLGKGGLQTITESVDDNMDDLDTVNHFWGVGFRIGEMKTPAKETENTSLKRHLDITWGDYENFGANRFTFEGLMQTNEESGLFIGFKAITGKGQDDVRIFSGLNLSFTKIEQMIKLLIPAGLQ